MHNMIRKKNRRHSSLHLAAVLSFCAVVLFACAPQEPVRIVITPTQAPTETVTEIPTLQAAAADITSTVTETVETPQVSATATVPTEEAPTTEGAGRPFGSIIDQNYTLPPTSTSRPTRTPVPSATLPPDAATPTVPPTVTPTPEPLPALPDFDRNDLGVQLYYNMDVQTFDQIVNQAALISPGWIKMQVDWSFIQPNGPDEFGELFLLFEQHVERVARQGFKILLSVAKAPAWARSNQSEDGPPDDPAALANFLRFMLAETKIGPNVDVIEVWNEPNLVREWQGTLPFSGAGYMRLFSAAYDAIRSVSPDMGIVTAGLAPTGTSQFSIDDRVFLQQMYDAGLGNYRDIAIGAHPYGWANAPDARCCGTQGWDDDPHFFFIQNIEDLRAVMIRNNHAEVEMWVTEFGWPTWSDFPTEAPEPWMGRLSPFQQAEYTLRALEIGRELDYLGPMFLWNLNFANQTLIENRVELAGFSLLYPDLRDNGMIKARPLFRVLTMGIDPS